MTVGLENLQDYEVARHLQSYGGGKTQRYYLPLKKTSLAMEDKHAKLFERLFCQQCVGQIVGTRLNIEAPGG